MEIREMPKVIRQLLQIYYGDGHVFFVRSHRAVKVDPYVTLHYSGHNRQTHASKIINPEDEYTRAYRDLEGSVEINLYTQGRNLAAADEEPVYENTAIADLEDFLEFLDSDAALEFMDKHEISILIDGDVQDVSAILHDSDYQYRAMVRLKVSFCEVSYGFFGQNDLERLPNDSHGGSVDMITPPYVIEEVDVNGGI